MAEFLYLEDPHLLNSDCAIPLGFPLVVDMQYPGFTLVLLFSVTFLVLSLCPGQWSLYQGLINANLTPS